MYFYWESAPGSAPSIAICGGWKELATSKSHWSSTVAMFFSHLPLLLNTAARILTNPIFKNFLSEYNAQIKKCTNHKCIALWNFTMWTYLFKKYCQHPGCSPSCVSHYLPKVTTILTSSMIDLFSLFLNFKIRNPIVFYFLRFSSFSQHSVCEFYPYCWVWL